MNKKIIILDDLVEQSQFFLRLLHEANYKVFITEEESELLDSISNQKPDIILLSATLKDKDCYLICKKIKLLEISENIPVIFINRDQRYFDAETMFNSGGSDYINYPFSSGEILHRISTQIKLKSLQEALTEKTNQLHKLIPHYQKLKLALEKSKLELANITQKDQSSFLPQKEEFAKILEQEWLRGARQRSSFGDLAGTNISLIMAKINDFTVYQNNHEKDLIDNCLNILGKTLQSVVKRPGDVVGTFSQGLFVILLPNTDQDGAEKVAQMVNSKLESLQIPHHYSNFSEYISCSFGIATGIPSQALPPTVLIEVAENALNTALSHQQTNIIVIDNF
ncbi:diguanylate cyclase/phosphodiesterase with PAS/PAC sensor [Geminocystis sp. NIES-3708]|uniref:diguanylate cyclase domain-containing protein n=1 Tax=Geminocystis sp. NIES-3708 TaxID=1615909 RepID=UPI0005FC6AF8|nr:diguanylate cyclase [Geminocystis sp. NIES-3708]BAQ62456.1 diguanylate cyclase/phosphodiesterase with PAS/PAC sensor [Geminocystis sp. NIES-3708]